MDRPLWFQQLRNVLRERRIAPRYVERFMDELWCHYLEMNENEPMNGRTLEDETALLARLGKPEILAAQAEQVQYNTWSGRHPWLAFLCGPVAIFLGLWLAMACFSVACLLPLVVSCSAVGWLLSSARAILAALKMKIEAATNRGTIDRIRVAS